MRADRGGLVTERFGFDGGRDVTAFVPVGPPEAVVYCGADVVMTVRSGGHGDPFWAEELPLMVAWLFAST